MELFKLVLDWTEAWALLIPIFVLFRKKNQPYFLQPTIYYLFIALYLNLLADIIGELKKWHTVPMWFQTNNYIYNLHSIVRFVCFSLFFNRLKLPFQLLNSKVVSVAAVVFMLVNFIFLENFFEFRSFSSRLLTMEAGLLLVYCLQYYLFKMRDEQDGMKRQADFWVVTGLSIYVVINFFIFLFYTTLIEMGYIDFVLFIWYVHNVSYFILCIFIAKALNASSGH